MGIRIKKAFWWVFFLTPFFQNILFLFVSFLCSHLYVTHTLVHCCIKVGPLKRTMVPWESHEKIPGWDLFVDLGPL